MKNFREYRENVRDLLVGESNKEERHKLLEKIKTHSEYQDAEKEQALDRKNFGQIRKYLQDFVDKKYKVLADQAKKDAIGWQIPFALRVIAHTEDYELGLPKEGVDYFLDFYAGRVKGEIKTGKYGRDGYYSSREEQELPKVVPEGKGEFEHSPKGKVLYPTSEESAILKTKIERQKYLSKEVLDIFSSEEGIDKLNKALEDAMNNGLEAVGMYQSIYSDYAKLFKVTPEELKELFPINREKAKICASKLINSFYFERAEETIKFFELENDEDLKKKMKQKKEQWEKTKEAVVKNLPKVIERKGLYMFSDQPHSHFDVETPYGAVHGKCWYSGKKISQLLFKIFIHITKRKLAM